MSKIIIVEDDPMLSEIYQMTFSGAGFEVFLAENGKTALDVIKKENVDVVLSDLIMPEMDGFELIKILRGGEYDPKIKIIITSNLSDEDNHKKAIELGANGFIIKSNCTPSQLVEEAKKIIAAV